MDAPIRRGAEADAVDQLVFDVAIAVEILDERHPGQVGGADAEGRRRRQLGLDVGLLDEHVVALRAVVADVGDEGRRPDVVVLVADLEVEALDIGAETGVVALDVGALVLVALVGDVGVHLAAQRDLARVVVGGGGGGAGQGDAQTKGHRQQRARHQLVPSVETIHQRLSPLPGIGLFKCDMTGGVPRGNGVGAWNTMPTRRRSRFRLWSAARMLRPSSSTTPVARCLG